jgi:capsular polysaccharide biosynthesis protein
VNKLFVESQLVKLLREKRTHRWEHAIDSCLVVVNDKRLQLGATLGISAENNGRCVYGGVVVGATLSIVNANGVLVPGGYSYSRNWSSRGLYRSDRDGVWLPRHVDREFSGKSLILGVASHYGHFYVDFLDRLSSFDFSAWQNLVVDGLHDGFRDWVEFFGLSLDRSRIITLPFGHCARFEEVTCYSGRSIKPFWSPETVNFVRDAARRNGCLYRGNFVNDVTFVTRRGASKRRLLNLEGVVQEFPGFNFVDTADLSLREQAELFNRSRVIIGPIGSDLFNVAYCQSGALVICLVSLDYVAAQGDNVSMLRSLCAIVGVRLCFVACDSTSASYDADLSVSHRGLKLALDCLV